MCFDLAEQIFRAKPIFDDYTNLDNLTFAPGSVLDTTHTNSMMVVKLYTTWLLCLVKKTEEQKLGCFDINVNGTDNMLSASVSHNVAKFIFASSSEVYGEPNQIQ